MSKNDQFPWDILKAECLRLVCSQLVQASNHDGSYAPGRKEDMIQFLQSVSGRGLDTAIKLAAKNRTPGKSNPGTPKSSPRKRRISYAEQDTEDNVVERGEEEDTTEETYNTRYKGVKRVKVHADPPEKSPRKVGRPRGRPRKSAQPVEHHPSNDEDAADISISDQPKVVKRGRGRPRKNAGSGESKNAKPSSQKQVFDGVVLEKRNPTNQPTGELPAEEGEEDGDGEIDEESEDLVLTVINGNGNEDLSSLGGSNKENDPNEAFKYTSPGANDVDADGDLDEARNDV